MTPRWLQDLSGIEPSEIEPGTRLYPCSACLNDGSRVERVYFITRETSKRLFGQERPEQISGRWVDPGIVASVVECPTRLPPQFANQIYGAGESRMGCYLFTLVFSRWYRRKYLVGGFIDFLTFPRAHGPSEIKEVILHVGASQPSPMPEYAWCVYPSYRAIVEDGH